MSALRYFRAQAHNNAWANHRLLSACARLSPDDLAAPRTSFFPSIILTLNHIFLVDRFYVSALEGSCVGYRVDDPDIVFADFADLDREQRALDGRLIAVCNALHEEGLDRPCHLVRPDWVQTEPADRILLHLFQHDVHHRGQVHAMLAGTGVAPPQLDEFFLGHPREQDLRREDFAALNFSEAAIWD